MIFFYYFIDFQKLKMLFEIKEPIFQATVLKRPSQYCKTPYVADVYINGTSEMAHTPSLGCCGLADKEANVIVKKVDNEKSKCPYKIMLSQIHEKGENIIIGIDPKLAEELTLNAIQQNYFTNLQNIKNLHREKTFMNSRFDFCGIDQNDIPFILEVKNVPLADYIDASAKDKKNLDFSNKKINDKIAYFPDGYRKKKNDVVSPRALKHVHELQLMKQNYNCRSILCFVIQRSDVSSFQPSLQDPIYRQAVIEANNNGVEIFTLQVKWTQEGKAYFITDQLPIELHKSL